MVFIGLGGIQVEQPPPPPPTDAFLQIMEEVKELKLEVQRIEAQSNQRILNKYIRGVTISSSSVDNVTLDDPVVDGNLVIRDVNLNETTIDKTVDVDKIELSGSLTAGGDLDATVKVTAPTVETTSHIKLNGSNIQVTIMQYSEEAPGLYWMTSSVSDAGDVWWMFDNAGAGGSYIGSLDGFNFHGGKLAFNTAGNHILELDGTLALGGSPITGTGYELGINELGWLEDIYDTGVTSAEFDKLDGLTATTAELNKLDGVTATTAELNYTDGVTSNIQTQIDATPGGGGVIHYEWFWLDPKLFSNAQQIQAEDTYIPGNWQKTFADAADNEYYYASTFISIPVGWKAEIVAFQSLIELPHANYYFDKVVLRVYTITTATPSVRTETAVMTEKTDPFGSTAGKMYYYNNSMDNPLDVYGRDDSTTVILSEITVRYQIKKVAGGSGTLALYNHAIKVKFEKI
jgi:hypothetical protein